MKLLSLLTGSLVALAATTITPSAQALETPRTAGSLQIGLGFRYGIDLEESTVDPWRTGIGLEVGYTTEQAIYFGGFADYFFGEERRFDLLFDEVSVSANVWQLGAEGGYDLQLGDFVLLRPKLGLGLSTIRVATTPGSSESDSHLGIAPGLTAMFFASSLVLSIDTRYQMVLADPMAQALILSFGIGF